MKNNKFEIGELLEAAVHHGDSSICGIGIYLGNRISTKVHDYHSVYLLHTGKVFDYYLEREMTQYEE